jgi:hypothetical protein
MPVCQKCRENKPRAQFGKRPDLAVGIDPRCKVCINEKSKATVRKGQLLRLASEVPKWEGRKLVSEFDYLLAKLNVIGEECRRRGYDKLRGRKILKQT